MPVMPVVEELAAQGAEVTAVAPGALRMLRSSIPKDVLRFISFESTPTTTGMEKASAAPSQKLKTETPAETEARVLRRIEQEVTDVERAIRLVQPDVILADPFLYGVTLAAERQGIPAVSMIHHLFDESAAYYWPLKYAWRGRNLTQGRDQESPEGFIEWWNGIRNHFRLENETRPPEQAAWWTHSKNASVLLTHPEFRYGRQALPDYAKIAVPQSWEPRGLIDERKVEQIIDAMTSSTKPQVLLTDSSFWQPDTGFREATFDACRELGWNVTFTLPSDPDDGTSGQRSHRFLPHSRLLPFVDVLVTAGGMGTVHRAVEAHTPTLACPTDGTTKDSRHRDTTHLAKMLVDAGVARSIVAEEAGQNPAAFTAALLDLYEQREVIRERYEAFDLALENRIQTGEVLDTARLANEIRHVAEHGLASALMKTNPKPTLGADPHNPRKGNGIRTLWRHGRPKSSPYERDGHGHVYGGAPRRVLTR